MRAAKDQSKADECIYVTAGELTDTAQAFAAGHGVRLLQGAELAALLPLSPPASPASRAARS